MTKNRLSSVFLTMAAAGVIAGCGESIPPLDLGFDPDLVVTLQTNSISGLVTVGELGGCSGIEMELDGPDGQRVLTSGQGGSFTLEEQAAGAYKLRARAEGFTPIEEIFVFDGAAPLDLGVLKLEEELVVVEGTVELDDGENPAGTVVELEGEKINDVPTDLSCPNSTASTAAGVFKDGAVVGAGGRYEVSVPRRSRGVTGTTSRTGYTSQRVEVTDQQIAAATVEAPATIPQVTLYPLTGFVNVEQGGLIVNTVNDPNVTLQISAFNANEVAVNVVDTGQPCTYGSFQQFQAQMPYTLPAGDGARTICVKARNGGGDVVEFSRDIQVDTTAPSAPSLSFFAGGQYLRSTQQNISVGSTDGAGSGPEFIDISEGTTTTRLLYNTVINYGLLGEGLREVSAVVIDRAGNRSAPGYVTITVDTQLPTYTEAITNIGRTVTITLSGLSASGSPLEARAGYTHLGGGPALPILSSGYQGIGAGITTATISLLLPAVDGSYGVQVQVRDAAGNDGTIQPSGLGQVVVVDENPPSGLNFDVVQQAVSSATVNVVLTASDTNAVRAEVSESLGFASPTVINLPSSPFNTTYALSVSSPSRIVRKGVPGGVRSSVKASLNASVQLLEISQ